jgi:hypothetical protein
MTDNLIQEPTSLSNLIVKQPSTISTQNIVQPQVKVQASTVQASTVQAPTVQASTVVPENNAKSSGFFGSIANKISENKTYIYLIIAAIVVGYYLYVKYIKNYLKSKKSGNNMEIKVNSATYMVNENNEAIKIKQDEHKLKDNSVKDKHVETKPVKDKPVEIVETKQGKTKQVETKQVKTKHVETKKANLKENMISSSSSEDEKEDEDDDTSDDEIDNINLPDVQKILDDEPELVSQYNLSSADVKNINKQLSSSI